MARPLYLKRLLQIALLALATLPVLGALLVGILWLRTSLPHPLATDETATTAKPDVAPRLATIPWKRDANAPLHLTSSPAWLPWQKMPKGAHPTPSASPPPVGTTRVRLDPAEATTITDGLADPARRQNAVDQMQLLIDRDPLAAADYLRNANAPWTKSLLQSKSYAALDHATEHLMIAYAYDPRALESLAALSVRSALAAGDADLALDRCRAWFAISTLYGTAPVLAAIEEALTLRHATKAELRAFRASFAEPATTAPATAIALSLKIDYRSPDAAAFLAAGRQLLGEDYGALSARGNLYVLGGRPDLARPPFRRAFMLATDQQLPAASENFARLVKAETLSISAANTFLAEHP